MGRLRDLPEDQKNQALDWLESLPEHPEYGHEIKRTLKKINPQIHYPELDIEDRVQAKTKESEEKIDAFLKEQKDRENKTYWQGKKKAAIDAGLLKEEEIEDFHKWMITEHLGNYERAAKMWHDEHNASAEPTNFHDVSGYQLPSHEGLFSNPNRWARDEAMKSINEIKRNRRDY
jgi:hypothetical protein